MCRTPKPNRALAAGLAVCGLVLLAGTASAQSLPTPRAEREPNPAIVRQEERAAGIAPGAAEQRRDGQAVDQLYRDLTAGSTAGAAQAPPPAAPMTPAQEAQTENRLFRDLTGQSPGAPATAR